MARFSAEEEALNPFIYNQNIVPVPVIASFDTSGQIIPLYIRYEGLKLKIDNIKWSSSRMEFRLQFCCEVTLQDRVQEIVLYYHRKLDMWTIERVRN